jgi:hypothetical protein
VVAVGDSKEEGEQTDQAQKPEAPQQQHWPRREEWLEQLPAGWTEEVDEGTGRAYYYNEATAQSVWEVPEHRTHRLGDDAHLLEHQATSQSDPEPEPGPEPQLETGIDSIAEPAAAALAAPLPVAPASASDHPVTSSRTIVPPPLSRRGELAEAGTARRVHASDEEEQRMLLEAEAQKEDLCGRMRSVQVSVTPSLDHSRVRCESSALSFSYNIYIVAYVPSTVLCIHRCRFIRSSEGG